MATTYRLYTMDGLGRFGSVQLLEARDDDEAIHLACRKTLPVSSEIWVGDRLVAAIPPFERASARNASASSSRANPITLASGLVGSGDYRSEEG